MKATLRSVLPAGAILAVVVAAALLVTRATAEPPSPSRPWTPPAGFMEIASVQVAAETHVSLWLGRVGPPKPDDCWYLVRRSADGDVALGGCGGEPAQPWVVRFAGIVAGGTGENVARWVRIGSGEPIAVTQGHFIVAGSPSGPSTSVDLLDADHTSLAHFSDVAVGGQTG